MRTHIQVIAWIHIVSGGIYLLIGAGAMLVFLGIGSFAAATPAGGLPAFGVLGSIGTLAMLVLGALGLPDLVTGWGLLQRKNWARILCIILSVLSLWNFPIGTAISVYSLLVMCNPETARECA